MHAGLPVALSKIDIDGRSITITSTSTSRSSPSTLIIRYSALSVRTRKSAVFTWFYRLSDFPNQCKMFLECRTMVCPEFQDSEAALGQILLIEQVLIADDKQIESARFGHLKQLAIFEIAPAHFYGRENFMIRQCPTHLHWRADIQKHFHAASSAAIRSQPARSTF